MCISMCRLDMVATGRDAHDCRVKCSTTCVNKIYFVVMIHHLLNILLPFDTHLGRRPKYFPVLRHVDLMKIRMPMRLQQAPQ